jgi:hypothetical protein
MMPTGYLYVFIAKHLLQCRSEEIKGTRYHDLDIRT